MPSKRARHWCFTWFDINNPPYFDQKVFRGLTYQQETSPTTGKPHYQGHLYCHNKCSLKKVQKSLGSKNCHLEICGGNVKQNNAYCLDTTKPGTSIDTQFVFGEMPQQGRRRDLEDIGKDLLEGKSTLEIMNTDPDMYIKYFKGMKQIEDNIVATQPLVNRSDVLVKIYWGPTGTGKSHRAVTEYPDAYIWRQPFKWFPDYRQETTLIIDEYDSSIPIAKLLGILDKYKFPIEYKGGHTYAAWTTVIITSNINPTLWHSNAKMEHRRALARRISAVEHMTQVHGHTKLAYEPMEIESHTFVFHD